MTGHVLMAQDSAGKKMRLMLVSNVIFVSETCWGRYLSLNQPYA